MIINERLNPNDTVALTQIDIQIVKLHSIESTTYDVFVLIIEKHIQRLNLCSSMFRDLKATKIFNMVVDTCGVTLSRPTVGDEKSAMRRNCGK